MEMNLNAYFFILRQIKRKLQNILYFFKKIIFKNWNWNPFSLEQIVMSLPEYWFDSEVRKHIVEICVIRHAGVEHYKFLQELPPAFRTEMHFAQRHIYHLKNVKVNIKTAACCTENLAFLESYGSLRRWLLEKPVSSQRAISLHIDRPVTCVNSTGYYHFLLEETPRLLWVLRNFKEVQMLRFNKIPFFVNEILDELRRLGYIQQNIIALDNKMVFLKDYIFTQAEIGGGFVHTADLTMIRDCFLGNNQDTCICDKRIYISRKHSPRHFDNEIAVEEVLREHGFEAARLENMSFKEQVDLFRRAEVVVAPHGAGLSNIIWSKPGTYVVEIFSRKKFVDCYASLSSQLKCHYVPLWARETNAWGEIDIEELLRVVKRKPLRINL